MKVKYVFVWGIIAMSLLISLGHWQLRRAAEKRTLLHQYAQQRQRQPTVFHAGMHPMQYQRMRLRGHYESPHVLLDNQFHQHQWGYQVLTPFRLQDGFTVVLVNRGWIKGEGPGAPLPALAMPKGEQVLTGSVYYPLYNRWIHQPALIASADPMVIEQFLPAMFPQILHQTVEPFMMRLDSNMPNGWVREWQVVTMSPARHVAYAIQWYALALVLGVGLICVYCQRGSHAP